jgi:dihydrofolate reductase
MNATSLDGFIARLNGDSDWAADDEVFEAELKKHDCIIIGRKTFEQYKDDIYPVAGVTNFVLVGDARKFTDEVTDAVQFLSGSPAEVLMAIADAGFISVLLGGGSETNARFAKAGLIDEVILDVHPLLLGEGKPLLGTYHGELHIHDTETYQYNTFTQIRAKIKT